MGMQSNKELDKGRWRKCHNRAIYDMWGGEANESLMKEYVDMSKQYGEGMGEGKK